MRFHDEGGVYVWDRFIRLFHWSLVIAFTVAFLTEDDALSFHVWAGYAVGILVAARLIWGFIGPRHARFSDFVYGPTATIRYVRDLLLLRAQRHIGHSPGGGAMVILLLLSLSATVTSGLIVYGMEKNAGPLAGAFAASAIRPADQPAARSADWAEDRDRGSRSGAESAVKEVHEFFANFTLVLIFLHIGAVALASLVHRENLVRAMITGYKRQ